MEPRDRLLRPAWCPAALHTVSLECCPQGVASQRFVSPAVNFVKNAGWGLSVVTLLLGILVGAKRGLCLIVPVFGRWHSASVSTSPIA